jgi:hypothetical protein
MINLSKLKKLIFNVSLSIVFISVGILVGMQYGEDKFS